MTGFSDDDVTEGLMAAIVLAADDEMGRAWARQFGAMRDALTVDVAPGETVSLTLGVILMDQGKTLDAVLLLTSTRAVLGWSSGLLRRRSQQLQIPYTTVRSASWAARRDGRFNGAHVCTIEAGTTTTVVLPKSAALGDRVVELLVGRDS